MRIAILSRNKGLHSIRRLLHEARKKRVQCDVINPLDCQIIVSPNNNIIQVAAKNLEYYDAILPRIGASITDYGLAVVRQFETMGMPVVNSSRAIADSRDKMRCLQILSAKGIHVPASVLTRSGRGIRSAVQSVGGLPVVLKLLKGTQGVGVMLLNAPISVASVMDTLRALGEDIILQQFIAEGAGRDYRAFVIGNRVVAAMMRTAPEGEFRSNIHRGGEGKLIQLPKSYMTAAVRAAKELGLEIAGVDLMESNQGPLILEVNSSPGFEGIEKATGLNIAGQIIAHIIKTKKKKRRPSRKKRK